VTKAEVLAEAGPAALAGPWEQVPEQVSVVA
jgi:hypothetical protein